MRLDRRFYVWGEFRADIIGRIRGSRLAFGGPELGSKQVRTASSDPRAALLEVSRELMQEKADVGNEADRLR